MNDNYEGPVRLQRAIPWGKKDKATAEAVIEHMRLANPPIVVQWSPRNRKTLDVLRTYRVHVPTLADLHEWDARLRRFSDHSVQRAMRQTARSAAR
jgi:hypothetical protein